MTVFISQQLGGPGYVYNFVYDSNGALNFSANVDFSTQMSSTSTTNIISASATFERVQIALDSNSSLWKMDYGISTEVKLDNSGNRKLVRLNGWFRYVGDDSYTQLLNSILASETGFTINVMTLCE